MEAMDTRRGAALRARAQGVDWGDLAAWALGFGLVAYLGLDGGGFDPLVHDPVAIAVWWLFFAGILVGALPRRRTGPLAWSALGLLAAFVAWTALSSGWTESPDKTSAELARVAGYLGVFVLALFLRGPRVDAGRIVAAVGAAVAVIGLIALLSRLQPGWFPEAAETGRFLDRERLSYPLDYWNALGALIAIGVPALLQLAADARSLLARALAAGALPAMALVTFFTLSRSGIAAAVLALALFLVLCSDRLPKILTLLLAGGGAAVLIAAATQRDALREGLSGPLAQQQGDELLPIALAVCLVVGLAQVGLSIALDERRRPRWTYASRRQATLAATVGALVLLIAAIALDAPGRGSETWDEFKSGENPGSGVGRLSSAAGLHRYDFWASALDQNATRPLSGTGAGTFEYWWAREGDVSGTIRDAHSLYMQTLGEVGIVGLVLLLGFLFVVFIAGGREMTRAGPAGRSQLAAAFAGCFAFTLTAASDWHWQIPVLPIAFLLLASVLVGGSQQAADSSRLPLPFRLGFALAALAAIVAIAIPLATTSLLRESESEARAGNGRDALEAARSAQNVQPGAAAPRLQQALVLEEEGDLPAAARAARAATAREETNWRAWLVLSRIEAQRGRAAPAVSAYRRARSLNPHFSLFVR